MLGLLGLFSWVFWVSFSAAGVRFANFVPYMNFRQGGPSIVDRIIHLIAFLMDVLRVE